MRMIQAAGYVKPSPVNGAPAPATPAEIEAVQKIALSLAAKLDGLRDHLRKLESQLRPARAAVAEALQAWVSGMPKFTPLDASRQFAASEQQRLRDERDGTRQRPPGPTPGPSALDRMAMPYNDANGTAFAMKQMVTGHRRGAYPASAKGRQVQPHPLLPVASGANVRPNGK
jgi:hypothetical protein